MKKLIVSILVIGVACIGVFETVHYVQDRKEEKINNSSVTAQTLAIDALSRRVASIDWSNPADIERLTKGWPAYTDKQGFKDRIQLKEQHFDTKPYRMQGSLRKYNESGRYQLLFILPDLDSRVGNPKDYMKERANLCNDVTDIFTGKLGSPIKRLERSSGDFTTDHATSRIDAQWRIKHTQLTVMCHNLKMFDSYIPFLTILVEDERDTDDLQDLIYLKCTYKKRWVGNLSDKGLDEDRDINLVISPTYKSIESNTVRLGEVQSFNNDLIVTKLDDEKINAEFKLDRITASFTLVIRVNDDQRTGTDGWGDCQKVQPSQRF